MADDTYNKLVKRRGKQSADDETAMLIGGKGSKRKVKERNPFSNLATPQLEYTAETVFDSSTPPEVRAMLDQELADRRLAMDISGAAAITDLSTGLAGGVADITTLSKIPQVAKVMKPLPLLGTAAGIVQGGAQVASGVNPYGVGMPSGWNVPIDAIEGSYGFAGPAYPIVQALAGGVLSEFANESNMNEERKRLLEMQKAGNYKGIEELILNYASRDWDRGKVSQIFSSGLQDAENKRREMFKTNYKMLDREGKDRALDREMEDRYNYDQAMLHSNFVDKAISGHNARRNAGDGYDSDKAKFAADWVKSRREAQKKTEEESTNWDFRSFGL